MSIYDVRLNSDLQVKDPAVSNGAFDSRGSRQMCMQACPLGLLLAGIKEFREMTDEWLDFIIDCRSGKKHAYDIVIGAMADDQIYNYVSEYMDALQESSFGYWQNSSIQRIRLISVQRER